MKHKNSKDIMSVIIILETDVKGGETFFYDGEKMNDIGKRAHVLDVFQPKTVCSLSFSGM